MPAKPLSEEQKRDAQRLKSAFRMWQSARRERAEPFTQDEVAENLFGFGQSALSQYLNGTIPLNLATLAKFTQVLGVRPENISPGLAAEHHALSSVLAASNVDNLLLPGASDVTPALGDNRERSWDSTTKEKIIDEAASRRPMRERVIDEMAPRAPAKKRRLG